MELRPFCPPWWLRNPHSQTFAATLWTGPAYVYRAVPTQVVLNDGDAVIVHDDCPPGWLPGQRVALLMHGLIGSHSSPLLVRLAAKLIERGVRVFRWDFRGCGAGAGLAKYPYHAGCSHDLAKVVNSVIAWSDHPETRTPHTSTSLVPTPSKTAPFLTLFGVSLSGNILLKYLGESPETVPAQWRRPLP